MDWHEDQIIENLMEIKLKNWFILKDILNWINLSVL